MRSLSLIVYLVMGTAPAPVWAEVPGMAMQAGPDTSLPVDEAPLIEVVVLGSGTPVPDPDQFGPSMLIRAGGQTILLDAGRGVTSRLAQVDPALVTGIDAVVLTHLHSDHVTGLPDLYLNGWAQGRHSSLRVIGPVGTAKMMEGLRLTFAEDIRERLSFGAPPNADGLQTNVTEHATDREDRFTIGPVTLTAYPVVHGGMPAFGYRIDHADATVAVTGDTTVTPVLATLGKGVDVLLSEVLSPLMVAYLERTFPPTVSEKIIGLHLTAGQAATLFKETMPSLAIFYHTVVSPESTSAIRVDVAKTFAGPIAVATDLTTARVFSDRICIAPSPVSLDWECHARRASLQ